MDLPNLALTGVVTVLLLVQGASLMAQKDHRSHLVWTGRLAFVMVTLALCGLASLSSGTLVVAREVGAVLVQGTAGRLAAGALLVGSAVSGALVVHVGRTRRGRPPWIGRMVLGALVVGGVSVWRMQRLDDGDDPALAIRAYDLWSPILLVWLVGCHTECALALLDVRDWAWRALGNLVVPLTFAVVATRRDPVMPVDPWSPHLWKGGLWLGAGILAALLLWRVYRAAGRVSGGAPPIPWWRALRLSEEDEPGSADAAVSLLALVALVAGVVDLFSAGWLDPIVDLLGIVLAWTVVVEVVTWGPLQALAQPWLKGALSPGSRLRAAADSAWTGVEGFGALLRDLAKRVVGESTWAGAIFKILLAAVLVIVVGEIPNAGATVVRPFQTAGLEDQPKDLGEMVAARLVNTLGLLQDELRPEHRPRRPYLRRTVSHPGRRRCEDRRLCLPPEERREDQRRRDPPRSPDRAHPEAAARAPQGAHHRGEHRARR